MKSPRSYFRHCQGSSLLIYGLLICGVGCSNLASKPATKRSGKSVAQLVEDIRNRNKPPKLVKRSGGHPRTLALFPVTYDWKEEKRVLKALDKLYQENSVDLWEELVRKEEDNRYCVTVVATKTDDAHNFSVGVLCHRLAYSQLTCVFAKHLPGSEAKGGEPFFLDIGIKKIRPWRLKRAHKSLYELQIEVCQMALRVLPKYRIPKDQEAIALSKIKDEIKKLRKTRKPFFFKREGFYVPYWDVAYTPKIAKQVREIIKTGSAEDIEIIR